MNGEREGCQICDIFIVMLTNNFSLPLLHSSQVHTKTPVPLSCRFCQDEL